MEIEHLKEQYETLVSDYQKAVVRLNANQERIEEAVQKIIDLTETVKERVEKQLRYDVEDLEKEEMQLEAELANGSSEGRTRSFPQLIIGSRIIEKTDEKDVQARRKVLFGDLARPSSVHILRNSSEDSTEGPPSNEALAEGWNVSPKEIECDKKTKLGNGAFGDVFKGKLRGKEVAIKKLSFQQFDQETLSEFTKEVGVMTKLRHPNVILFMGACTAPGNLAMITELMPRGSVYDLLQNKEAKISFQQRLSFAKDTVMGMNWLHCCNPPILHLDLKTHNLLIDENYIVKVADFGLSRVKSQNVAKGKAGSPVYMAPEMLLDLGYDEKADIYSFGIVLWELYTQEEPYKDKFKSFDDLVEAVTKKGKRPDVPDVCPPKLKTLIQQCWNPSPAIRPPFARILKENILDHLIIESHISERNEMGRRLWSENFLEQTTVPANKFLPAFYKTIGVQMTGDQEDIFIQCLKILIVKKDKSGGDSVSLEDFSKMLEWFGPLELGSGILQRIEAGLRFKGFFGEIETSDAEKLLNGKKKGTYLIRFSTRDPGCYAITVLTKLGALKHYRISHKAGQPYIVGTNEHSSLEALVKAHKKELYLKYPHVGSKYEAMFNDHDKHLEREGYGDPSR
ncbi:SH2 domain-containing protein [Planoprotostelium fungivorum]|uniref:SH2 domain-containing protein n=1 Tax=Planoprotostelium fungivorum TaxID=1890364 RepID=A0A2P6MSH2_9EUKA|nr:SH2 domain-containing protein [Planoprotostelium fungivorum]